jgi:hypothetical protein
MNEGEWHGVFVLEMTKNNLLSLQLIAMVFIHESRQD